MAQAVSMQQPGLYLDPNPLGGIAPEGALAVADNCVIRYAGILESRRGFAKQSTKSGLLSLNAFGSNLVAADPNGGHAYYFNGSSWVSMGTISAPPAPVPLNEFFQAQKALYVTSGTGLQRTDAVSDALQLAGLIRAAPFAASSITFVNTTKGIAASAAVAYTALYQRQVGSLFDIVSPPSTPITAVNNNGTQAAPLVTVALGPQLVVGDVVQLYRTVTAASGIPSDEFFLVQSFPVTSAMLAIGSFQFLDEVPDVNLGTALYTNSSQEGAAQENDAPPMSGDVCQFLGYTIYANTTGYYAMDLQLVVAGIDVTGSSVPASNGLQVGDILTFNVGSTVTLTAGTDFATTTGNWDVPGYVIQSLADTINANTTLHAHFQASPDIATNTILLEAVSPTIAQWSLQFTSTQYTIPTANIVQQTSPATTAEVTQTGGSPTPVPGQIVTIEPVSTPDPNFPGGSYIVNNVSSANFFYTNPKSPPPAPGTTSTHPYTWQNAYPWLAWNITGQITSTPGLYLAENSADPAGLSFSKFQQPEAVPLENSLTVGDPTYPIARIVPLRQSVLIFKQGDGIWQLVGTNPNNFTAVPYDQTTQIAQPWSAAAVGDTVCLVSTKGPVSCDESGGVRPLARPGFDCPIREEILKINTFSQADVMFGIGYESERLYILWTPTTNSDEVYSYNREAWVYSLATTAWTRWPLNAQAGFVNARGDNKLYYTDGTLVLVERKDYADTDYQDVGAACTIASVSGDVLAFSGSNPLLVGDYVTQGGASGWVLSVSGLHATLISVVGTFTSGAANFARAITCTMTRLPWAGSDNNPGLAHRFQEVAYNFRLFMAPFLTVTSSTSLSAGVDTPDQYVVLPTAESYGVNLRKGFNPNNTQGIMLQTGFIHAAALTNFNLQSTSLVDEPVSTRTGGG